MGKGRKQSTRKMIQKREQAKKKLRIKKRILEGQGKK
jgi:hypothetical protein